MLLLTHASFILTRQSMLLLIHGSFTITSVSMLLMLDMLSIPALISQKWDMSNEQIQIILMNAEDICSK